MASGLKRERERDLPPGGASDRQIGLRFREEVHRIKELQLGQPERLIKRKKSSAQGNAASAAGNASSTTKDIVQERQRD